MMQISITWIVTYSDPDRPVDGIIKTRQFPTYVEAKKFVDELNSYAPNAFAVQLVKQTSTTERERIH